MGNKLRMLIQYKMGSGDRCKQRQTSTSPGMASRDGCPLTIEPYLVGESEKSPLQVNKWAIDKMAINGVDRRRWAGIE